MENGDWFGLKTAANIGRKNLKQRSK